MKRGFLALIIVLTIATAPNISFAQVRRSLSPDKAKDVVCGMMVDKDPKLSVSHRGELFYFCSRTDLEMFSKNPERYVKK